MSILDSLPSLGRANASPVSQKPFVIVHSRDVSLEQQLVIQQHGKLLNWSPAFLNVNFDSLEFEYLLIDVRTKEARLTLNRQDLSKYHLVSYCYWIQKNTDDFVKQLDCVQITSIPECAVNSADFNEMLLNAKIHAPSVAASVVKKVLSCWSA